MLCFWNFTYISWFLTRTTLTIFVSCLLCWSIEHVSDKDDLSCYYCFKHTMANELFTWYTKISLFHKFACMSTCLDLKQTERGFKIIYPAMESVRWIYITIFKFSAKCKFIYSAANLQVHLPLASPPSNILKACLIMYLHESNG
jgi:magnesium-transporting ATPase (P-type)